MQELIIQQECITTISEILLKKRSKRSLLVIASHIAQKDSKLGLLRPLSSLSIGRIIKLNGNVTTSEIDLQYTFLQLQQPDAVIAIGGGSVIDLAKCLILKHVYSNHPKPLFLAIPTTAGSGSEATTFAVAYHNGVKYSQDHPSMLPDVAILDASLLTTLNPLQWGLSGIDTLAHGIESYWNKHATAQSKSLASDAICKSLKYLPEVIRLPLDPMLQASLLIASHEAGKAINITRTTGPHALSYYLTGQYGIPHGQAVALFLPVFYLYNVPSRESLSPDIATPKAILELNALFKTDNSWDSASFLIDFMRQVKLNTRLSDFNINHSLLIDQIIGNINHQRFQNNPIPLQEAELKDLCKKMLL